MPFNIIICGAGLGGLGAAIALKKKGHNVILLEGAPELGEIGAGIQIPPNSSRILKSYGVYDSIQKVVVWPRHINFRRYATGAVIGPTPLHPDMTEQYGFPCVDFHGLIWIETADSFRYWLIHRADYHDCLLKQAKMEGVKVQLNSFVERVDEAETAVILSDGRVLGADLIVGADGIRSKVRQSMLGDENLEASTSSNCAYRATVSRSKMMIEPAISGLMDDINANCWIGPQTAHHGLSYSKWIHV